MGANAAIHLRNFTPADIPFIKNSWLKSNFISATKFIEMTPQTYYKYHGQIADDILSYPTTTCVIASNIEDTDLIYGYAVYEESDAKYFHYIYVKRPFNGFGIARQLITASPFKIQKGVYATHSTPKGRKIIRENQLEYCPYF